MHFRNQMQLVFSSSMIWFSYYLVEKGLGVSIIKVYLQFKQFQSLSIAHTLQIPQPASDYQSFSMENRKLSGIIYGATGAIGQLLVKQLINSDRWGRVIVVGRSTLPEWEGFGNKLKIETINMDDLKETNNWKYQNIDTVFCCLGSQTKHGDETFIKIDKTYPLFIADIAKANGVKHYSLVSSIGASSTSWFLYPRTKGEVEAELSKKGLNMLSIFRPGLLNHRKDARFVEKIASFIPFMPKIESSDLARCLRIEAERNADTKYANGPIKLYENSQILSMIP